LQAVSRLCLSSKGQVYPAMSVAREHVGHD